jgi:hypothetical protein
MPVAYLNATSTQNTYVDALTVQFAFPRPAFSVNVFNAAIMYQVAVFGPAGREANWEGGEHRLDPSLSTFDDPAGEGFPPGSKFAGIRIRSALSGVPAIVTVA